MTPNSFAVRLEKVFETHGRLCVGIDPHSWLLNDWGLADSARGAEEFSRRVIAASVGVVGIVKPQVAFYERFGSEGFAVLERVIAEARAEGLLVIADSKRGDVGSTIEAYGQAWLASGAPLEADAVTLSAFQGLGSLAAPLGLAAKEGKGIFVLAATSNPEAAAIQTAIVADSTGRTVAGRILDEISEWNAGLPAGRLASVGAVLGATLTLADYGIDTSRVQSERILPVLAPGFGHQGALLENARAIYGEFTPGVIVSESRSVLSAGPRGIVNAVKARAQAVRSRLA